MQEFKNEELIKSLQDDEKKLLETAARDLKSGKVNRVAITNFKDDFKPGRKVDINGLRFKILKNHSKQRKLMIQML